jgi:hypothetical protein
MGNMDLGQEKGTEEATNGKGGGFKSSELSDHEMGDIDELLQGKDYPTCPQWMYSLHFLTVTNFSTYLCM